MTSHNPAAEAVLDRMEADADAIAARMAAAARAELSEYAVVRDPAFEAEVAAHAVDHVHAFVRCARNGRPPSGAELDFVRDRAAQRARELLPLDALLQAYLIGQRTTWEVVVALAGDSPEGMQAAQVLTAVTFDYTHAINVALAGAYVRERQALTSDSERSRRDVIDHLLAGRAPDPRRASAVGLRTDTPHAVVVAEAPAGRLGLVVQALSLDGPQTFVAARNDEAIALVAVYVRRGPLEVRAAVDRAAASLSRTHGVELRAGISAVCATLADVARGYGQASRALAHAPAGGAVALEEVPLVDYLVAHAGEGAGDLGPGAAEALDGHGGALAATLRAYADCDMNVARAAERLVLHPNTVHYRLKRITELTGRDPRRFADLLELLLASRLREVAADS